MASAMAGEKVDLEQLRARLAKLGVELDGVPLPQTAQPSAKQAPDRDPQRPWAEQFDRNKREVTELLDRCNTVERALNSASREEAARSREKLDSSKPAGVRHGRHAVLPVSTRRIPTKHPAPAAQAPSKSPSHNPGLPSPKQGHALARAAEKLFEELQQEGLQNGALPIARLPAGRSADASRSTPLGTVLAQYKEAQAAWAHEKAQLRREAVTQRKRANKLELDHAKLERLHAHRMLDVQTLRAALKGRDLQLQEATERTEQLEQALARANEVAAEQLAALASERDDLQGLLLATLDRLENVDEVVARAGVSSALMEDKVRELDGERLKAVESAVAARAEAAELSEARQRLLWQSKLLERLSEVQLRHNKRKSEAIKQLLTSGGSQQGEQLGCDHLSTDDEAASLMAELGPALAQELRR